MPRPPTWLPRLHEVRRTVAQSVRSLYERKDLERLFELQPRAAQNLLALLPSVPIGKAHVVEREALVSFLDQVHEAPDIIALFEQIRREKAGVSRRKLRGLVRRDFETADLASLPQSIGLSRGRLEVSFRSVEELAEAMFFLARLLDHNLDAFAQAFEPERSPPEPGDAAEIRSMFAELEDMESVHTGKGPGSAGQWDKPNPP